MKLLFYEMRKTWLKLPILLLMIAFCILNVYKINENYQVTGRFAAENSSDMKKAYYQIYESTFSGEITAEKIKYAMENYNKLAAEIINGNFSTEYDENRLTGYVYGDYSLYHTYIIPEMEYAVTYPNITAEIVRKAYDNIAFFTEHGNYSDAAKNKYIYDLYKNRQIKNYNLTEWSDVYFKYDFSALLVMIMIICGLANSFSAETESGMYMLITASGKNVKTAIIKLISAALYVLFLTIFFTAADMLIISNFCKIDGLSNPVYSANVFAYSPFNFTLLGAVIMCAVTKFLAFTIIAELIMIISAAAKNSIVSVGTAFALCAGLIIAANRSDLLINPVNLLTGYELLSEFKCVTILGKPMLTLYAVIILYAVGSLVLGAAAICLFKYSGRINCVHIRTEKNAV